MLAAVVVSIALRRSDRGIGLACTEYMRIVPANIVVDYWHQRQ